MPFDLDAWKRALREHLGHWAPRTRGAAPGSPYAALAAATLWPLLQALRGDDFLPAMTTLGGVAGGSGGNVLARQLRQWADQPDGVTEAQVSVWLEEQAQADSEVRAALDAIVERTDAVRLAEETLSTADRRLLLEGLPAHLRGPRQAQYRATLKGPGAIAQGPGATAAGAGGFAVGGDVRGSVVIGSGRGEPSPHPPARRGSASDASTGARGAHEETRSGGAGVRVKASEVAIVYGRNEPARRGMFEFLRSLGLHPVEFSEAVARSGVGSPYIGDVLRRLFNDVQAVVVVLTGDEVVQLRESFRDPDKPGDGALASQARPNVLFEAGLALGGQEARTILVQIGRHRPFSDIGGRYVLEFNGSAEGRNQLAERLAAAGCVVNRNGQDWLTAGGEQLQAALAATNRPLEVGPPGHAIH